MLEKILILALAVSAVSVTLAKFKIAEGFRDWLSAKGELWAELAHCYFCLSWWVALPLTPWFPTHLGPWGLANLLATWLATVGLSALLSSLMVILGRAANHLWRDDNPE